MSISKAYDEWSSQYDDCANKTRDMDAVVTVRTLARYTFGDVLELGCGTGKNTATLLESAQRVIGLDFSAGMLALARTKVADPRAEFRQADLTQPWPVDDGIADLITSSLMLEHIDDLDFIFGQARAKSKPGGLVFVCELHPFRQYVGSGAKYESDGVEHRVATFVHHTSDFVRAALAHGFEVVELDEWFDEVDESGAESQVLPRLISFVFRAR